MIDEKRQPQGSHRYDLEALATVARTESLHDETIKQIALREGFNDMRYDGLKKALRGLTTIEEVVEATFSDSQ